MSHETRSHRLGSWISKTDAFFTARPLTALVCLSLLLVYFIESCSQHSPLGGLLFLVRSPLFFGLNALIVLGVLSLSLLSARRRFFTVLIATVFAGFGIANGVVLTMRITPIGAVDFAILKSVLSIVQVYLNLFQIILILAAFAAAFILLGVAWVKLKKSPVQYRPALLRTAGCVLAMMLAMIFAANTKTVQKGFGNLAEAYRNFGFTYCFVTSIIDQGIDEPEEYSPQDVSELMEQLGTAATLPKGQLPNIVMVQLESFYDVNYMKDMTFSENPVPNFTELKAQYSSGFLTVPSIGAGTANTEFEVLAGMSLDYFGVGEYPYKTVLKEQTCESVCYDLKPYGYSTRAIHNNDGTFYDRHIVFTNLGFDAFTSIEYMDGLEYNELGWAKDTVLTREITKALRSTDSPDFVYTVSVQAHGEYPEEASHEGEENIQVSAPDTPGEGVAFEYYVSQLSESDAFVGQLVKTLEKWEEPTVLVLFGDHLPTFGIENEDLENGDIFQTEYVLWSNFGLEKQDRDLQAYQLCAYVQQRLGMDSGALTKLHQQFATRGDYQQMLEMLQYDMLYGEQTVYRYVTKPQPTVLQMGVDSIAVTGARQIGESLYILGSGFTEHSVAVIDGKDLPDDTMLINSGVLLLLDTEAEPGDRIAVSQCGKDGFALSTTAEYIME